MSKQAAEPTRIHYLLGTIAFLVFLALAVASMFPDYSIDPIIASLLVMSYLVLLGFGALIRHVMEARYG